MYIVERTDKKTETFFCVCCVFYTQVLLAFTTIKNMFFFILLWIIVYKINIEVMTSYSLQKNIVKKLFKIVEWKHLEHSENEK